MHKKSFMIIVLTILLFQPILAGIGMPSAKGTIHNPRVVAQGFRVDPSELIDHVPILINGTDDFISQGWTGAGTTNNPYRISSLNITRDVGQICIDIMHTNAYFVIEDCFIKQDSLLDAIRFTNTSHGRIVYTTVYGQDASAETLQAIHLINANNTVVNHVESYGRGAMGLYAVNSYVLTVSDSTFDSDWYRALRVDYSEGLLISNCELSNTPSASWWCVRLDQVNQTTIENSEFYSDNGESGISLYRCFESSISNCYLWGQGVTEVVEFDACPELILHNVTTEFGIYGIFMSSSPGVALSDVTVSESEINGIYIWACANSTFSNVDLTDTGDYGISFTDSSNNSYTDITVTEVFEYGIYGTTSDLLTFEDIHATDIDGDAFFMTSCDNGSIVNSEFHHITDSAIYIDAGANWTVTNNLVEETGANGIYQYQGENFIATDNVVNVCEYGIYVDDSPDALVTNNIVTESTDTAIYGASCDRGVFSNNEIHDSYNGMSFDSSVNLTVSGNTIGVDGWTGIDLYYIITSTIEGNTISNSPYYGITISYYSQELEIIDNVLNDCGFFFMPFTGTWGTPFSYIYFNHTFSGNTINGMDLYYGRDVEGLVLDADDYAQFILLNASDVTIHDGTFDLVTCPIEIIRSENVVIDNVVIPSNIRGIVLASGENVTISDTSITGVNNFGDYYGGIEANYIDNLEVLNCDISRSEGMVIANAELAFVNNTEFSYCDLAIRGYASDNITVSHSSFLDLEGNAFYAFPNGAFTVFTDNMVKNATNGIYIEDPNAIIENNYFWQIDNYAMQLYDVNHIIHNNEIYHAGTYGIYLGGSANFANITENYIESCDIGILSNSGDDLRIYNNTILYCAQYAIDLYRSSNSEIYYNIFALSGTENARDRDTGAYTKNWDDGSVLGNWWDDYTPPGAYSISGGAGSVDNYPMVYLPTEPIVDHPLDLYYAEGSEGNTITWRPFDDYLKEWKLYIDDALWDSDAWDFVDVTVNVDGLAYGTYEAKIIIFDNDLNSVTDIVMIHVYDGTPPVISNTPNAWAFVGGSGQTLSWQVSDLHPNTYLVTFDGDEYDTGTWTTGSLSIDIDGLPEGEHTFVTTIYDIDGNSAVDRVDVRVINDDVDPTIDSPSDITYTVGETGNNIVWNPEDMYPAAFEVSYNGTVRVAGSWGGARVIVNVDGLAVGTHVFSITVEDGSGNSASDSVTVTVLPIEGVEPPPEPLDVGLILIVAGVAAAAVVIVVVFMLYRKRGAT